MKNTIQKVAQHIQKLLSSTINNQKGVVLPIILMTIGGLSLIGAAAVSVANGEMNIAHNDRNYKVAFNLAEAGINDAADAIQGNRDILPIPLGTINSASYSFNVGGAAFNNTGRYNVSVYLPVYTSLQNIALVGASSVDVLNVTSLNVGDSIIMGDANIHVMAKISSIIPTGGTTGTLTLVDGKNQTYILTQQLVIGTRVSKNLIRITSTGEAGVSLNSTYNAVALWRASSTINANPNIVPPAAGIGMIRSTVTLQGEYSIQEINIIGNLQADVNPSSTNSKLNGPVLISDSPGNLGNLSISPYAQGDYSGPIFMSRDAINAGNLSINKNPYNPITGGVNATYPKIIPISTAAAQKADVNAILAKADANATCYQQACNVATATQQIYNLNGYRMDVKAFKPDKSGTGLLAKIDPDSVTLNGTNITFSVVITNTFTATAADNLTVDYVNPGPPVPATPSITPSSVVVTNSSPGDGTITLGGANIKFNNGSTYSTGYTITITIPGAALAGGTYVYMYDNSNNAGGLTPGSKQSSNGVWMSALGNIESQQWQGDTAILADAAQGSHTHLTPTIQTTAPTTYVRGWYAISDNALNGAFNTAPVVATGDMGAVLFGGKKSNAATWVVGDQAEFYLTYFIHTNGPNCADHDIKIVSRTKVTYLGTSTKCSDTDVQRVFVYETIWNHLSTNKQNIGVQNDDNDPKLVLPTPHKGYFKWSRGKDVADNELIIVGKSRAILIGDKEFNSIFNHAADPKFHSSIVNLNISQINMIGSANPPTYYSGGRMYVDGVPFPTIAAWIPANAKNWDWTEMIGIRSGFDVIPTTNGFDYVDFSIASGSILPYMQSGNSVLPDASATPGAAGATGYTLYKATSAPAEVANLQIINGVLTPTFGSTWGSNGIAAFPNNGTPIMNPSQMGTTTITATISGPWFSSFNVRRGSVNLFFDAANGIPFNVQTLSVETKGSGSNIMMGSPANPATIYAGTFSLKSEDCGGQTNFSFTGKMIAGSVEFEGNVKYDVQSTMTNAPGCLSTTNNFIYLKKSSWKELRN